MPDIEVPAREPVPGFVFGDESIIDLLPVGVSVCDVSGQLVRYNPTAARIWGRSAPLRDANHLYCGGVLLDREGRLIPPADCAVADTVRTGRNYRNVEMQLEQPDGTRRWILDSADPILDRAGQIAGAVNCFRDITARFEADVKLLAERTRHEEHALRLAAIVESSQDAIISKDTDGFVTSWNGSAERLFGYTAAEAIGQPISILIPPDRVDEAAAILDRIRRGEQVPHFETVRRRKDGSLRDISLTVSPLRNAAGKVIGASKIARDITERKRAEAGRQLLINELNHRVKNTLATVQAMAAMTFRGKAQSDTSKWFEGRLMALSKAHDLLTRESWESADLRDIIAEVVAPHWCPDRDCFTLDGPELRVPPKMAVALAIALHELGSNAAKYGALSNDTGVVAIVWRNRVSAEGSRLHLVWTETDGPPVNAPERLGFGAQLIERTLASEPGGKAELRFPRSGVVCTISAMLPPS